MPHVGIEPEPGSDVLYAQNGRELELDSPRLNWAAAGYHRLAEPFAHALTQHLLDAEVPGATYAHHTAKKFGQGMGNTAGFMTNGPNRP